MAVVLLAPLRFEHCQPQALPAALTLQVRMVMSCVCVQSPLLFIKSKNWASAPRQVPGTENMTLASCTTFQLSCGKNNVSPGFAVSIYFLSVLKHFRAFLRLQASALTCLLAPRSTPQGALVKITPQRSPVNLLYPVPLSIRQPGSLTIPQFLFHGKSHLFHLLEIVFGPFILLLIHLSLIVFLGSVYMKAPRKLESKIFSQIIGLNNADKSN